jgi:two-component system CheB/CheR fusion protein
MNNLSAPESLWTLSPTEERDSAHAPENALCSPEIGVVVLGADLVINFVSTAGPSPLHLRETDIGRRLSDTDALTIDSTLLADLEVMMRTQVPVGRALRAPGGRSYARQVLPYRTTHDAVAGAIVAFVDTTRRDSAIKELNATRLKAEHSKIALLRRLAEVNHDLRQPLQTLSLIGGLLAQSAKDRFSQRLIEQLDQTLHAMSGMLYSLHYGGRVGVTTIHPEISTFSMNDVLTRLRQEFAYHAQVTGLELRVVPCSLSISTDFMLFEQTIRSLLEQAVERGKCYTVLVGCRRRHGLLRMEIWCDRRGAARTTPGKQVVRSPQDAIPAHRTNLAKRLAELLNIRLRSPSDQGPTHVIEVSLPQAGAQLPGKQTSAPGKLRDATGHKSSSTNGAAASHTEPATANPEAATIFVVDDDEEACTALRAILEDSHRVVETYSSAEAFLDAYRPAPNCCLVVDAHLTGMQGVDLIRRLNDMGWCPATVMISGRGDIATVVQAMKAGALDFVEKPIVRHELMKIVDRALADSKELRRDWQEHQQVASRLAMLTERQRQVMALMLEGLSSKTIGSRLFMSRRTVESHRANIMVKMSAKSLPELARMVSKHDSAAARDLLQSTGNSRD